MSDSEDEDRPPTAQEQRKWKELQLDRERSLGLAFYYSGIPTSLNHDEWLRQERRKKRAKDKKRAESKKQSMESPEVGAEYNQFDDGSSDGSTGTLQRKETNQSLDLIGFPSQQPYPTDANVNLHSPSKDKWFGMVAIIDSGTKENWISQSIATRCGLKIQRGTPIRCLTFSGEDYESDSVAKVTWRVEGVRKSVYTSFHIGENAPFDVLFGTNLVDEAPELFRTIPSDPNLVLIQKKPNESEKNVIKQNRADHEARSRAVAERTREKQREKRHKAPTDGEQSKNNEKR